MKKLLVYLIWIFIETFIIFFFGSSWYESMVQSNYSFLPLLFNLSFNLSIAIVFYFIAQIFTISYISDSFSRKERLFFLYLNNFFVKVFIYATLIWLIIVLTEIFYVIGVRSTDDIKVLCVMFYVVTNLAIFLVFNDSVNKIDSAFLQDKQLLFSKENTE